MFARLQNEEGFGLVELLIAMTVMSIAIFALVAGFSSSAGALNRASKTRRPARLPTSRWRRSRRSACGHRRDPVLAGTTTAGPDGRTYWVEHDVTLELRHGVLGGTRRRRHLSVTSAAASP